MSAFLCSDLHISIIAGAIAADLDLSEQETADYLKSINIESVNYRYKEKTRKTRCKLQSPKTNYSLHDIAKLMDSYLYQACEKDGIQYRSIQSLIRFWQKINNTNSELSSVWCV
jgi:hypothetical protein